MECINCHKFLRVTCRYTGLEFGNYNKDFFFHFKQKLNILNLPLGHGWNPQLITLHSFPQKGRGTKRNKPRVPSVPLGLKQFTYTCLSIFTCAQIYGQYLNATQYGCLTSRLHSMKHVKLFHRSWRIPNLSTSLWEYSPMSKSPGP